MDQNNSSSQGQDNIQPTKNISSLNLLSQQSSKNQENLSNMQNQLENTNITITTENSIKKKLKCQIFRQFISQNKIFEDSVWNVINQNQDQHAFISYQDQDSNNSIKFQSSQNFRGQNFESISYFHQKIDNNFQKNQQQQYSDQSFKNEYICDQINTHHQKNIKKEIQNIQSDFSQNDSSKNQFQFKQKQITQELIYQQVNCAQIKELQEKLYKNLKNDDQQQNNMQNQNSQRIFNQENACLQEKNEKEVDQTQHLDQSINDTQKNTQQSDKAQQKNTLNLENIPKEDSSSQYNYCIQKIFDELQNYKFNEFEKKIQQDQQGFQVKKVWEQEIFDRVNPKEIQSEIFQSQKQNIFERLKQEQFYLCKIINTNLKEDLILGFSIDEEDQFDEYVFKIIQHSQQANIDSQNLILKTLGHNIDLIQLEQEKITILALKKIDYLQIQNQFQDLVQFKSNIKMHIMQILENL
ncbi:hypothetical protein ABPG73_006399 [Tetrahymena malaccensis]